jgi:hypothetical protein
MAGDRYEGFEWIALAGFGWAEPPLLTYCHPAPDRMCEPECHAQGI